MPVAAHDLDAAAVRFDDRLRDVEPETRSLHRILKRTRGAEETVEDAPDLVGRKRVALTAATAAGISSGTVWWSRMITSSFRLFAKATSCTELIPQSAVTSTEHPASLSR